MITKTLQAQAKACGNLFNLQGSGEMQKDAFPLELAHEEQFPAVFGGKGFEGELFAGEPVYGKEEALFGGSDDEMGFILLNQGKEEIQSELGGPGRGLVLVSFALPNFELFLKKSGQPVNRNKFPAVKQTWSPKSTSP
jgi:hypothetical protein